MYYQFFSLEESQAIAQREENKYASLIFFLRGLMHEKKTGCTLQPGSRSTHTCRLTKQTIYWDLLREGVNAEEE